MTEPALARCVGDPQRFLDEDWERHVSLRTDSGTAELLSLDDVDRLLAGAALRAPSFRLVQDGAPIPARRYLRSATVGSQRVDDLIDPGRVHALFADGATVVLQGLQRYWPPLTRFCRALEQSLDHPVQANAYLTPPRAAGLDVHSDAHDVFAIQTFGEKHWTAWPRFAPLDGLGEPALDHILVAGDVLYVPRDTPHLVRTGDAASLHITIGVRVVTRRDVLRAAVEHALAGPELDAALPPGWPQEQAALAADLAADLERAASRLSAADPGPLLADEALRFRANRQPALAGQLHELLTLEDLADDTLVRRRPGTFAELREDGTTAEVVLGDRRVRFPARVGKAVRVAVDAAELRPADLSGLLDAEGRLVLIRRLIAEGLLVRGG